MSRYAIFNNKDRVLTPGGAVYTAEEWLDKYAWGKYTKMVVSGGVINGALVMVFDEMVETAKRAGCDFSDCTTDREILDRIEEFEDTIPEPSAHITDETRIADALEDLVVIQEMGIM